MDSTRVTLANGQDIHYYVGGDANAAPIVLLHGGGVDSAKLSWELTFPALVEAGFRVYAPDWPGYGESAPPSQPYTQELLIATVEAFRAALGLERMALVGLSMGGGAAIGYTLAYPERVRTLTMVGAYGLQDRAPMHALSYFLVRIPGIAALTRGSVLASRSALRASMKGVLHNPAALTDALLDEVKAEVQRPHSMVMFNQLQRDEVLWSRTKTCYMPRLHEIQIPVLIAHGANDAGVDLSLAEEASRQLPHAELHIFANAGHWTQRDYPERFNAVLIEFLRKHGED